MTPQQEGELMATVRQLAVDMSAVKTDLAAVKAQQERWKGALAMLATVSGAGGAVVGWAVTWFHK